MPKRTGYISKTQRILAIFHLFRYCEEVSMAELSGMLPGCKRTFSRDIELLKRTGMGIRYSSKRQAFVCDSQREPDFPEGKAERRYLEKIIRLTSLMRGIPTEDCDVWYMENIPGATKRTMQRDFATLNSIGYHIKYVRSELDVGYDEPINRYYCLEEPNGAYALVFD